MANEGNRVLLTGATGYVGGQLLPALVASGKTVRCLARKPDRLLGKVPPGVEIFQGDILDPPRLSQALQDIDVAYYLVHSMEAVGDFEDIDRRAATNFIEAASRTGAKKIVYLGGLAHGDNLSSHLRSRMEVGEILRGSDVPVIEFRASIIIGAGSLSFEMVRALVSKLPIMTTPKWVSSCSQPIYIGDVVSYLLDAADLNIDESVIYEIGGADRVSYLEIMQEFARATGKKRLMIPVPVLTPWLSSLWLGLVTPLQAQVGRKLIEGVRNASIVNDNKALHDFSVKPLGIRDAVRKALETKQ